MASNTYSDAMKKVEVLQGALISTQKVSEDKQQEASKKLEEWHQWDKTRATQLKIAFEELQQLRNTVDSLQKQKDLLEKKLRESINQQKVSETLTTIEHFGRIATQASFDQLERERDQLIQQVNQLNRKLAESEQSNKLRATQLSTISSLKFTLESKEDQMNIMEKELNDLKVKASGQTKTLEAMAADYKEINEKLEARRQENTHLTEAVKEEKQITHGLKRKLVETEEDNTQLKKRLKIIGGLLVDAEKTFTEIGYNK